MACKRISCLGMPIDADVQETDFLTMLADASAHSVLLIGPDAWLKAKTQEDYVGKLNRMSLILPNDSGIAFFCRMMTWGRSRFFLTQPSMIVASFLRKVVADQMSLALVGGKPRDDEDMLEKIKSNFDGINIVETMHGYGELPPKIECLLAKAPQAVLVSMVTPRQEEFILALRDAGYNGFILGCGNFFEQSAQISTSLQRSSPGERGRPSFESRNRVAGPYISEYINFGSFVAKTLVDRLIYSGSKPTMHAKEG